MKTIVIAAALAGLTSTVQAQTPQPADWTTLTFTADLNTNADTAWEKIGGNDWCAIAKYLDVKGCTVTLAVEPAGKGHSKLIYTLIWNQAGLPDQKARTDAYEGRKVRFQAAVDKMAAAANAK